MKINGSPAPRTSPSADASLSPIADFIAELAARGYEPLQIGPDQFRARCCGHDGTNRNLSVGVGDDGRVLLRCHSQACNESTIAAGIGWDTKRLFPSRAKPLRGRRAGADGGPKSGIDADTLHAVYLALFDHFGRWLDDFWMAKFVEKRPGFPRDLAERLRDAAGYGFLEGPTPPRLRLEAAADVAQQFPNVDLTSVPGFKLNNGGALTIRGWRGFAVPARDIDGRIAAYQIRVYDTEPEKTFGKWLFPTGAKQCVHFPVIGDRGEILRVTEGLLKADVASGLSDTYTIGMSGLNAKLAMEAIRGLQPAKVLVSLDQEFETNVNVVRTAREIVSGCRELSIESSIETWSEGKGVDDHYINLGR